MVAELEVLLKVAMAVLVALRSEEDDATITGVRHHDVGAGNRSRDDTARKEELVLVVATPPERLEPSLLADATEDLQAVTVAFRHDDVARLGVEELGVVGEAASVAGGSPLVLRMEQMLLQFDSSNSIYVTQDSKTSHLDPKMAIDIIAFLEQADC